jgi:hypothetical protein
MKKNSDINTGSTKVKTGVKIGAKKDAVILSFL